MYEKYLRTSVMLSKIAGQWSASLPKMHDSTGVLCKLCYCKLTRFLCKWNMGRKRVNITSNLDSSYTSLRGVKEGMNHYNKELHLWSCRRLDPPVGAWCWKSYSVTLKKFYLQFCWGFKEQICWAGKPSSEEFIEHSSTGVSDVIITCF